MYYLSARNIRADTQGILFEKKKNIGYVTKKNLWKAPEVNFRTWPPLTLPEAGYEVSFNLLT